MSSAILYVAIVAIWIGVIVPRWLRHDHARDGHLRLRRFSRRRDTVPDAGEASARAGLSDDGPPWYTSFGGPDTAPTAQGAPDEAVAGPSGSEFDAPAPVRPYGWSAEEYLRQERTGQRDRQGKAERRHAERPPRPHDREQAVPGQGEHPGTADSEQRARVVRGRRRILWMLVVLTAIAIGFAYLGVAAWWIVGPPTVLLLGYLMLLREAAHADAEARERAAVLPRRAREAETRRAREAETRRAREAEAQRAAEAEREQARREQARREQARREQARRAAQAGTPPGGPAPVWAAHEALSHAEIIDISERVGDQLYDQLSDAKLRAVGN